MIRVKLTWWRSNQTITVGSASFEQTAAASNPGRKRLAKFAGRDTRCATGMNGYRAADLASSGAGVRACTGSGDESNTEGGFD